MICENAKVDEIRSWSFRDGRYIRPDGFKVTLGYGVKLGNYVKLGDGVTLGDYVTLDDGVMLGYGVKLDDYVTLGNSVKLGYGVMLGNSVKLGDGVKLGNSVKLGYGVKLGNSVKLGNYVKLGNSVKLGDGVTLGNYETSLTLCQKLIDVMPDEVLYTKWVTKERKSPNFYGVTVLTYKKGAIVKADGEKNDQQCGPGIHVLRFGYRPEWCGLAEIGHDLIPLTVKCRREHCLFPGLPGWDVKQRFSQVEVLD